MALLVLALACLPGLMLGQTASTGTVLGTVTDPTGAVVAGAQVELKDTATGETRTQGTNSAGQYVFPGVRPGSYRVTVAMQGFRTAAVTNLKVEVAKSYTVDVVLEVGTLAQTVEVSATARVDLQTTDAQIGNVISPTMLGQLPTLTRQAGELLSLQPGVSTATPGAFPGRGIRVTGAIDDQNAIYLDGIDVTENVIGGESSTRMTMIPVPSDSVEEFRLGVANPNTTFGRASGGQVSTVSRHGSNSFHGAVFWYHQNDELNANSWENNRLGIKRPELKDNRFGARAGGPILKNKTFFFADYEGRRFPQAANILRLVPSDALKNGILRFRDSTGNTVSYNLATSTLCGSGSTPCDPRGLGISPAVKALWALTPAGNDPTAPNADGLNTIGFRSTISAPLTEDTGIFRLDHNFNSKWSFNGRYTYLRHKEVFAPVSPTGGEVDIRNGNAKSILKAPRIGDGVIAGLSGQITPHLLNAFHFGWIRERNVTSAQSPTVSAGILNIPGTASSAGPIAIAPALAATASAGTVDSPIDVDTQRARFQATFDKNIQFSDDMTWLRGTHSVQFGTDIRKLPTVHVRADKVVGSLSSLVAFMDADVSNFLTSIPDANRPPQCAGGVTTNCLAAADVQTWDRLYAATLGLLDSVGIMVVRDGELNPLPLGTNLINDSNLKSYYFYGQDTWRMRPSLTLTYGLGYGWQTAPQEKLGRQTLLIDNGTGKLLTAKNYLSAKEQAALTGQVFNPQLAYLPVRAAGRDVFDTDWTNLAPRVAAAWNPSGGQGFFSRLLGDKRTVLRAGFGIVYDRSNTVQTVIIPMLGVGFAQTITVATPPCNVSNTPGPNCTPGGSTPGASLFRVGVDGKIPLPVNPPVKSPVVPAVPLSETLSFQVDPDTKIGRSYNFDFSIQRELPGNMVLEAAYTGRLARHLPQAINFSSSPYFFKDPASGQTFAQAFDAVATALRNNQAPKTQPWFENQLPGLPALASARCPAGSTSTSCMVSKFSGAFINGLVSSIFNSMGGFRTGLGLQPYNNRQVLELFMRTYLGESNYHGLLVTLRKRTSHGLTFDVNYTLSKALDDAIANQNSAGYFSNSFNTHADYGPSLYDRRHSFVGDFVYELPAGRGHRFSTGNWIDKIIGGWYTSGIFTAYTGVPLIVVESGQVWGGGVVLSGNTAAIPTGPVNTDLHAGIAGSNNIGTAGDPTKKGTELNLFGDPASAYNSFRQVLLSSDTSSGRGQALRGLGFWNLDMSLGKSVAVTERVNIRYSADFFNIFNKVHFNNPTLDLRQKANFGVISSQFVPNNRASGARWIAFGFRVEF